MSRRRVLDIYKHQAAPRLNWINNIYEANEGLIKLIIYLATVATLLTRRLSETSLLISMTIFSVLILSYITLEVFRLRQKLTLHRKWQFLAWTHYRHLLSEMLVRSSTAGKPRLDFLTYYNGEFENLLIKGHFFTELQYVTKEPTIDVVIFDIEYLQDLTEGVPAGDTSRSLVPFNRFFHATKQWRNNIRIPAKLSRELMNGQDVLAAPLRWGVNSVGIRFDKGFTTEFRNKAGVNLETVEEFDLDWLLDETGLFYEYLKDQNNNAWLITLDWYLPSMMLLAWHLKGKGCHKLQSEELKEVAVALGKLTPLMHKSTPLIKNPLELALKMYQGGEENLIVLGGGNWLYLQDGSRPPEGMRILPIKGMGHLLWCECIGFLADGGVPPGDAWRNDATNILRWLLDERRWQEMRAYTAFHGFAPSELDNEFVRLPDSHALSMDYFMIREIPPRSRGNDTAGREEWIDVWEQWKRQLPNS